MIILFLISPVLAQTSTSISISGTVLPHQPAYKPQASFVAAPQTGQSPLTVKFTDTSTHSPIAWKWEYKDKYGYWKQFSTLKSPSYTVQTGVYSIRLSVKNKVGYDAITKNNYITVTEKPKIKKPEAKFGIYPTIGKVPVTIFVTDKSLHNPTKYYWNFGDGTTSNLKNPPPHKYTRSGFYRVQLTVSNSAGFDTTSHPVIVLPKWWYWGN